MENERLFITTKELKKLLGISEPMLYKIVKLPGCPKISVGTKYFFNKEKFLVWYENDMKLS